MARSASVPAFLDPGHDHAPCLAETLRRAELAFEALGLRLTPLRRQVLQEIAGSHTAVGAYDILDRLARKGGRRLAPISVYRALESLARSRHGASAREPQRVLRLSCAAMAPTAARSFWPAIAAARSPRRRPSACSMASTEVAAAANFTLARLLVEVRGTCGACRKAAS